MSSLKPNESNENSCWKAYEVLSIDKAIPNEDGYPNSDEFIHLAIEGQDETAFESFEGYGEEDFEKNKAVENDPDINQPVKSIEDREQEGYQRGFEHGEKDGYELGVQRGDKVVVNIEKLLEEIRDCKADIIRKSEKEIIDIIFAVAEKITHFQLDTQQEIVKETILSAMLQATDKQTMTLRINPEDFDFVEKLRPELFETFRTMKSIIVSSDSSIKRGGCLIETPSGDIDARIETQLEKISQCLYSTFSGNANES